MIKKNVNELLDLYDLEIEKVVKGINENNAKRVLVQFPDGFKNYASEIVALLEEKTGAEFLIWFGSCFGACDYPVGIEGLEIDLFLQFGHSSLMPNY